MTGQTVECMYKDSKCYVSAALPSLLGDASGLAFSTTFTSSLTSAYFFWEKIDDLTVC